MPIGKNTTIKPLHRCTGIIYGPPKVGKSTFASTIPKAVFIATEAGLDHIQTQRWENAAGNYVVTSWEELLVAIAEVLSSDAEAIIIDTLGNTCLLCDQHVCATANEIFKGDGTLAFGKGNALILNELRRVLTKLSSKGVGVWLVAHSMTKTETRRTGEVTKTVPYIPSDSKSADLLAAITGMVDVIMYLEPALDGGAPLVHTKPGGTFDAGDRSGKLPTGVKAEPGLFAKMALAMASPVPVPAASTPAVTPQEKKA